MKKSVLNLLLQSLLLFFLATLANAGNPPLPKYLDDNNNFACPKQLLSDLKTEDFEQFANMNTIEGTKVRLILAVAAVAELRAENHRLQDETATAENIEESAKQLIEDIRLGFQQKQSEHFYSSMAKRMFAALTSADSLHLEPKINDISMTSTTTMITLEDFQQKILEIAGRKKGAIGYVLVDEEEEYMAERLIKAQAQLGRNIFTDGKWSKLDMDEHKKLLAFQFLYILVTVNSLDKDGLNRAEFLSCTPEVHQWHPVDRFGVFIADLLSTRVLAEYERLLVPKIIAVDRLELTKFMIRLTLAPSITQIQETNVNERWQRIVNFELGMESQGASIRYKYQRPSKWRIYALLNGPALAQPLEPLELIFMRDIRSQVTAHKLHSLKDAANAIRGEISTWKLEIIGGQGGQQARQLVEAILRRTELEMESELLAKVLKELLKGKHVDDELRLIKILCFYIRFCYNLSVFALKDPSSPRYIRERNLMFLEDWLHNFRQKLFEAMTVEIFKEKFAEKPDVKEVLKEILLRQYLPLYRLDKKADLDLYTNPELKGPSALEKNWLKLVLKKDVLFSAPSAKSSDGWNEERAKFGIRAGLRPFIAERYLLDFECGPITPLSNCLAFITNKQFVDFEKIIMKIEDSTTKDENYALLEIQKEFAQWADAKEIGKMLKDHLLGDMHNLLKGDQFERAMFSNSPFRLSKQKAVFVFFCYLQRVARLLANNSNPATATSFKQTIEQALDGSVLGGKSGMLDKYKVKEMQTWMKGVCWELLNASKLS